MLSGPRPALNAAEAAALDAAMDWMVCLSSGRAGADERDRFTAWRSADARHEAAWQRLEQGLGRSLRALQQVEQQSPGQESVRRVLSQPSRRSALKALLLLGGGAAGAGLADRLIPLSTLTADFHTRTGQRQSFTLADGARVLLNARSAADVSESGRLIRLLDGDLICDTPPSGAGLALHAGTARLSASHARVALSRMAGELRVFALRGTVTLAGGGRLAQGQGLRRLDDGTVLPMPGAASGAEWEQGYVSAAPLPLGEVLQALRRYTPAVLRVSPEAARLPVHASLPLADVPRALDALAAVLPVRVRRLGPWWMSVDLA